MSNRENFFYFIYLIFGLYIFYLLCVCFKKKCNNQELTLTDREIIDIIERNIENNNIECDNIEDIQIDLLEYSERELKIIRKYGHYKPDASSSEDE
jgi:hypothetical protein